jgi:hypothetical protein
LLVSSSRLLRKLHAFVAHAITVTKPEI